jgi:hypothetical protein
MSITFKVVLSNVRAMLMPLLMLTMLTMLLGLKMAYAQNDAVEPPAISQLVEALMAAGGTYLAAYVVNFLRSKLGVIPGSWFVGLVVPVLGLGISYLTNILTNQGNSWLVSFAVTLSATWLSQVQAQLNTRTGPSQYVLGAKQ